MPKTVGYLRVSTNHQDTQNQKFEVLDYCQKNNFKVDEFIEVVSSTRKDQKQRQIDILLNTTEQNDRIIVSELSRIGRSTVEVLQIINTLADRNIEVHCIKQNMIIKKDGDIQSKIMVTLFSLFSELERDLISQRTKQALLARKQSGKKLGRPKGSFSKSILDGKEVQIQEFIDKKVSLTSISKIVGVSRGTLYNFIATRKIQSSI